MHIQEVLNQINVQHRTVQRGSPLIRRPALASIVGQCRVAVTQAGIVDVASPHDLFALCEAMDGVRVDSALLTVFIEGRRAVGAALLERLFEEELRTTKIGETAKAADIARRKELTLAVWELVQVLTETHTAEFTPTWIQTHAYNLYKRIIACIRHEESGVLDWQVVKAIFPPRIRDRFVTDTLLPTEDRVVEAIKEYEKIAKKIGPEALAQFLISIGKAGDLTFDQVIRIIAKHLGRCNIETFDIKDLKGIPEGLLELSGVRDVIFLHLRNYIYQRLITTIGEAGLADDYRVALDAIIREAQGILDTDRPVQRTIFLDVVGYFTEILKIPVPNRIRPTIADKEGTPRPLPSLRQRIAMHGMAIGRRKLVSFFMGAGKTATAFLSKEHVGAKKMLYVCPTHLVRQTQERVSKYYKSGIVPSVGVVSADLRGGDLATALDAEVVVLPYSMFSSTRDGQTIRDAIKKQPFDFVVVDEAHWAKKETGRNAEVVYDFVTGIPNLYDKGSVLLLSGDPIPNTPNDIIAQLRIYDREKYGNVRTLRQCLTHTDPLVLRNALMDFMILIDPPEDWEQFMDYEQYDLGAPERAVYQGIWGNDEMGPSDKLKALCLSLINPALFAPGEMTPELVTRCAAKTQEYLRDYDCVVIGENEFKEGITKRHSAAENKLSFVEQLKQALGNDVEIAVIDGDTPMAERQAIFDRSKNTKGKKMVIVAMTQTMREGLDLSHIHRAILLEPNYNKPDTAQFVKRFQREGNRDVKVCCLVANDTVHMGILEHATYKSQLGHRFKYGGTLTIQEAEYFDDQGADLRDGVHILDRKLTVGTAIMDRLLTNTDKLYRVIAYLHDKGFSAVKEFIDFAGAEFAEWYMENWEASYSGNNGRFVAGLATTLETKGVIASQTTGGSTTYADVACGPLVLENTLGSTKKRTICSFDLNPFQIEAGVQYLREKTGNPSAKPPMSGEAAMHKLDRLPDGSIDALNCSLGIYYTRLNVRHKHLERDERVATLCEFNRVVRTGGVIMLTLPPTVGVSAERAAFVRELQKFGFEPLTEYTGIGTSTDNADGERPFENFTIVCRKFGRPNLDDVALQNLKLSRVTRPSSGVSKTRTKQTKTPDKNGEIHTVFTLQHTTINYANGVEGKKAAQEEHKEKMRNTRASLVRIYQENGLSFNNLPPATLASIHEAGIELTRITVRDNKTDWIFTLRDSNEPHEFVFPE